MREIKWVGSSLDDLKEFPEEVMNDIGYALRQAQQGSKSDIAKPLKGIDSGVMEIVSDYDKNTFRAVYTVKIGEFIYVLHCFQKKSNKGISTPKHEIDLIKQRLKAAKQLAKEGKKDE